VLFFENLGKSGIPEPELSGTRNSGSIFLGLISGNNFHYPNFELPELPDPKKSGNPNAQAYLSSRAHCTMGRSKLGRCGRSGRCEVGRRGWPHGLIIARRRGLAEARAGKREVGGMDQRCGVDRRSSGMGPTGTLALPA